MKQGKISIIVPVHNTVKYLRPCLDSILAQTFTDWEAILVDDGSKDQSGTICDEYSARDPRFIVVHKQNEGVAKARITAFEHSNGDLITFIDSDDYVSPEYLEKLSKPLLEQDADMVSSEICNVIDGVIIKNPHKLTGTYEKEQIKEFIANNYYYTEGCGYGMTCYLCTKMIKRELVLDGLKYGQGLWYGEDQAAMLHILYRCNKLVLINDAMYYYLSHTGQATKCYNINMWYSLVAFFEKCKELDVNQKAQRGIKIRSWIYITDMIFSKMRIYSLSKMEFCTQIKEVLTIPYMKSFFSSWIIRPGTIKNIIIFWVLKLRLFSLLYYMVYRKKK